MASVHERKNSNVKFVTKKNSLKKHVASVHEGIKPFKCKFCDYTNLKSNMNRHIHEENKAFQCGGKYGIIIYILISSAYEGNKAFQLLHLWNIQLLYVHQ